MKSLLSIVVLFVLGSFAWGQCPGGTCRPAEPVKRTASVLVKTATKSAEVTKQRVERRPLLRRIFCRGW